MRNTWNTWMHGRLDGIPIQYTWDGIKKKNQQTNKLRHKWSEKKKKRSELSGSTVTTSCVLRWSAIASSSRTHIHLETHRDTHIFPSHFASHFHLIIITILMRSMNPLSGIIFVDLTQTGAAARVYLNFSLFLSFSLTILVPLVCLQPTFGISSSLNYSYIHRS